jgi:hypothetical protein
MPLVVVQGGPNPRVIFKCANAHLQPAHPPDNPANPEATTMAMADHWSALIVANPPGPQIPGYVRLGPQFDVSRGIPVRAVVCSACGYVELYSANILAPQLWTGA